MWKDGWSFVNFQIPDAVNDLIVTRSRNTGLTRPAIIRLAILKEFGITNLVDFIQTEKNAKAQQGASAGNCT